ncbi:hypothetical protein EIN_355610 [Entamoeba invadens IP1]|uniref:Uncharacterized protein n=1 Tax=Entamoeba invadens IP1 TaxID=370355 RepID=L7FQ57_ENTIV|nr:hypothetical protein EIN_355610 [Entamoeba invadens IP1]ELP92540.1 hypothetical protein EIN_355610 [Entamoeba invadens IP1]|eukprot:XP_004259311.1 hypothetical protein EIN_355610 [Entamoeba invadens IP1]
MVGTLLLLQSVCILLKMCVISVSLIMFCYMESVTKAPSHKVIIVNCYHQLDVFDVQRGITLTKKTSAANATQSALNVQRTLRSVKVASQAQSSQMGSVSPFLHLKGFVLRMMRMGNARSVLMDIVLLVELV